MADEQTPTPQDPNVETTEAPALVVPPGENPAESAPQAAPEPGPTQTGESLSVEDTGAQTVAEPAPEQPGTETSAPVVTAEQNTQDLGANPSPGGEPADAPVAAPDTPEGDLPPGVAVGGSRIVPDQEPQTNDPEPVEIPEGHGPGTVIAQPVSVDGRNRRSDADALEGHWVEVTGKGLSGLEHDHQTAVFVSVAEYDQDNGYPTRVLVRFKDTTYEAALDVVDYADCKPLPITAGG